MVMKITSFEPMTELKQHSSNQTSKNNEKPFQCYGCMLYRVRAVFQYRTSPTQKKNTLDYCRIYKFCLVIISAEFLGQETREFLRDANKKIIGIKLTIKGAKYENTGNYECSAENTFGKAVELSTLTVNQVFGSGADASFDVGELS